jgi:hypothetical protein
MLFKRYGCRRASGWYSSHVDLSVFLRDIVSLAPEGYNSCASSENNLIAPFKGASRPRHSP